MAVRGHYTDAAAETRLGSSATSVGGLAVGGEARLGVTRKGGERHWALAAHQEEIEVLPGRRVHRREGKRKWA